MSALKGERLPTTEVEINTPVGVLKAGARRVTSSSHLPTNISSPDKSYADMNPPTMRITVSKTDASKCLSKVSSVATQSRAL